MLSNVDTLTGMRAFRQVVESGSFVAAAERLDVSTAMVSKYVMRVEQHLGVRLLNRNSRKISLTEPGRLYFDRCKFILDELHAAELELGSLGRAPCGTLRITLPSFGVVSHVADLLACYRSRYPEVVVDVSFEDRFADLVQEGYDVALRITSNAGSLPPGLVARPICPVTFYLAGSREYVSRHGAPRSPGDLAQHDFVALDNVNSLPVTSEKLEIPLRVVMRCRSMDGVANAVVAGIGVGLVPGPLFEDPRFRDVLTAIFPEHPVREATLYAIYVSGRFVPPKIRTFIDFLVQSLRFGKPASLRSGAAVTFGPLMQGRPVAPRMSLQGP